MERRTYLAFASLFALLAIGLLLVFQQSMSGKNFCTAGSRQMDACITLYDPVCGWTDSGPHTFSNSCFACIDPEVVYWTKGEC